ncbi:MAG: hypothetical protein DHS20C14_05570 [Phycisphaeraceae bacterium]|nr:MAG: hypothetical protein DHS20C14_05570 [Phycisphaeraceae bacterium]
MSVDTPAHPDSSEQREPAREVFRRSGIRCTRQREVIFDALRGTESHPTAEQLFGMVREHDSGMSLATVYNTLEALTERGLVRRIASPVGNGASRYDADTARHVHLTLSDGRVVDLPDELADAIMRAMPGDLSERMAKALGEDVGAIHIELVEGPARREG